MGAGRMVAPVDLVEAGEGVLGTSIRGDLVQHRLRTSPRVTTTPNRPTKILTEGDFL